MPALELCKGTSYTLFIESIKAEETRSRYRQRLLAFLGLVQYNTDELASLGRSNQSKLTEMIIGYILKEKERVKAGKIKSGTVVENIKPIRLFCEMNDIVLNWKKIYKLLPGQEQKSVDRAYSKDEIAKLLEFSDVRSKIIILIQASAGCRVGALPDLKMKHLSPVEIDGKVVCAKLVIYAGTKDEYTAFISLECYNAVQEYIEYRKRNHEKITTESPLIRNAVRVYNVKEIEPCRPVKGRTIADIMLRLLYRAGLRVKQDVHRYEVSTDHGFRKFFNTTCKDNGMDPLHKEMLMGHKVGLEDAYYRPADDKLLTSYLKVMPSLTINDAEVWRVENLELKNKLENNQSVQDQIHEMSRQLKEQGAELARIQKENSILVKDWKAMTEQIHAKKDKDEDDDNEL